jgi:glutamate--cysteine ligase
MTGPTDRGYDAGRTMQSTGPLDRDTLLQYFLDAFTPRADWRVGMEVERIGRVSATGLPLPYDGAESSVRSVLEFYRDRRPCSPILEADYLIGLDGAFGSITLEPGGQVEWSSKPRRHLKDLAAELDRHVALLADAARALGVRWLEEAVDPELPVSRMIWMPKARYKIMRPFLGTRGRLAHRMMTQSASIQCAYDFVDAEDWKRKFLAGSLLAPVATAMFANSSRVDGRESGYRSYRQRIWRETDPARCSLPEVVFDDGFDLEMWLDWVLHVPTIFRHRSRGLVPAGGVPFIELLERTGCDAPQQEDWLTHVSTIFTEVRSYNYLEVRSADLQPPRHLFAVPAFWAGLLYHDDALDGGLELGADWRRYPQWVEAMEVAARDGLDGAHAGRGLRETAGRALSLAITGLEGETGLLGDTSFAVDGLRSFAEERGIPLES